MLIYACVCPLFSVHTWMEQSGTWRWNTCGCVHRAEMKINRLLHDCTNQTLQTLSSTTVTPALTWCFSGVKVCQWMCVCVIMSMHIWMHLYGCVCVGHISVNVRASISPHSPCFHTCWHSCLGSFVSASSALPGTSQESPASSCVPSDTSWMWPEAEEISL